MSIFVSNLASKLDDFVALKNSLGIEYKTGQFYLHKLDTYNLEHGNAGTLMKEVAEGCGARCAEARNLKCENVHLDKGYVDILQAKAHKDRRLYLSNELVTYLKKYDIAIDKCFPNREYFFPGGYGGIISSTAVSANFRAIWVAAGLKRNGKVKPRAYDFRHHFACSNIMRWSMEGKNIHAMLGRPVIAASRIDHYDGEQVTFHYNRHEDESLITETIPALDFIKRLIIHIPEKHFKMVRYYGIYAKHHKQEKHLYKYLSHEKCKFFKSLLSWQNSILLTFGYDPLKCSKCGTSMLVLEVYHKKTALFEQYRKAMGYG